MASGKRKKRVIEARLMNEKEQVQKRKVQIRVERGRLESSADRKEREKRGHRVPSCLANVVHHRTLSAPRDWLAGAAVSSWPPSPTAPTHSADANPLALIQLRPHTCEPLRGNKYQQCASQALDTRTL